MTTIHDPQPLSAEKTLGRPTVPLNVSRYTKFYKRMLILSTIGTSFGLLGLFNIPKIAGNLSAIPLFGVFNIIQVFVLALSIWALVLLWLKRPLGIWLKLSAYVVSLLIMVGSLTIGNEIVKRVATETVKNNPAVSIRQLEDFMTPVSNFGYAFSIAITIALGFLWWKAWKTQVSADSNN